MSPRPLPRLALASVAVVSLAGCGDRPGYDDAAVESYLTTCQAATFAPAGKVGRATCPGDLELQEPMTFTCTLEVSGVKLPYVVRLSDVRTDEMSVSATPDGVLVSRTRLRDVVRSTLPKDSAAADLDCGGDFVVADVGETLPCTLTLGARERPIEVTVKDAAGRVSVG